MSDLIDRWDAIDAICDEWCGRKNDGCYLTNHCDGCDDVKRIKELPSAEPQERKTGKWINISDTCNECSECGAMWSYLLNEILRFRYCPNCGARMDSEQILSEADNDTAYGGLMSAT